MRWVDKSVLPSLVDLSVVRVELKPRALRIPLWSINANEVGYLLEGSKKNSTTVRWRSITQSFKKKGIGEAAVSTGTTKEIRKMKAGDIFFCPIGALCYFKNRSWDQRAVFLVWYNNAEPGWKPLKVTVTKSKRLTTDIPTKEWITLVASFEATPDEVLGTSFHVESKFVFLFLFIGVCPLRPSSCFVANSHRFQSLQEAETEERNGLWWRRSRVVGAPDRRRDTETRKRILQARSFPQHSCWCSASPVYPSPVFSL